MQEVIHQLELNDSVFIQFGIFFFFFVFVGQVYFKPFLKLFLRRYEKTTHDKEKANELLKEVEQSLSRYQAEVHQTRLKALSEAQGFIQKAKSEEKEILDQARDYARKTILDTTKALEEQKAKIKNDLESEVKTLSQTLGEKLISG